MRILLTGASGYVGQHLLTALLAAGHTVTALVRDPARLGALAPLPGVRVAVADLADVAAAAAALAGHDVVVHAALIWPAEPGAELRLRDVVATAALAHAAGAAGVSRLVYVSSMAAQLAVDAYGATKASGELFVRAAAHAHGTTAVVVRPGPVVGPPAQPGGPLKTPGPLAALVDAARAGGPLRVRAGEARQLTAAPDLARAVAHLVSRKGPASLYAAVDRAPIPWERVALWLHDRVGGELVVEAPAPPRPPADPTPYEALLGGPTDAWPALEAHLAALWEARRSR